MPDQATVRRALQQAELVVAGGVCHHRHPRICRPVAARHHLGEKTGTVTNSERRISRVRPAVPAPGSTCHDWVIATEFAQRLEARLRPGAPTPVPLPVIDPALGVEAVWNEHRESTAGRDLDITGMSYAALEASPAMAQWPAW